MTNPPPIVELQYAAHGARSLLPPRPETLPLLQDAADAYCGRRFLREQSLYGLVAAAAIAAMFMWTGVERDEIPLVAVIAAMALAKGGTLLRPLPIMMLIDAGIIAALYGALLWRFMARALREDSFGVAEVVLTAGFAVALTWIILPMLKNYRRYRRVEMVAPTPGVKAWLETLIQRLMSDPDHDLGLISFRAFVPSAFTAATGALSGEVSMWLLDRRHLQFVSRDDLEIAPTQPTARSIRIPVRVLLGPEAKSVRATMSAEHLARYEQWKTEGSLGDGVVSV